MFETLIESSGPTRRRGGETAVSVALHMVILAGAVHATERVVSGGLPRVLDTTVVFRGTQSCSGGGVARRAHSGAASARGIGRDSPARRHAATHRLEFHR